MRGSGAEGFIVFLGFILSPTDDFRPYIEVYKSSRSILDIHSGSF